MKASNTKVYVVTVHFFDPGCDNFKTAAFTSLAEAKKFMRETYDAKVKMYKKLGYEFGDGDLYFKDRRAWINLSTNEQEEVNLHITVCHLDDGRLSPSAYLD